MTDTIRVGWLGRMPGVATNPMAQYVRGKLLLRLRWYNPAAYLLQQTGTLTRDSTVEALREISIGDALWRSGRIQEARGWYWTSLNYDARPSAREAVFDRIARCDWRAALQMPAGDR
jgi:predicted negative regulator of RcsB-dependent stress response